jgi:hypothetical protein
MMSLPPAVMWIDPGKITGIAVYERNQPQQFRVTELDFLAAGILIESWTARYVSMAWVGWERYGIGRRTPQDDAHYAIKMIGVAEHWALRHQCRILTPAQQHTPTPLDQQRLKAIGWWPSGQKDAQSAAAHMLAWLMKENEVPPRERELLAANGRK